MTYHAESLPDPDDAAAVPVELNDDEINALLSYLWQRMEDDNDE